MVESNVDLARRGFAAVLRGDVPLLAELLDSEIRWHGGDPGAEGACRGRAESLAFIETVRARFDDLELLDAIPVGDQVVVLIGPPLKRGPAWSVANLTTFRDGRIVEIEHHESVREALAAASALVPSIAAGTLADLPALVELHHESVASSHASFDTRPGTVADRRDWFDRFAPEGPHRLLVAHLGPLVIGYAASGPYRAHDAFRETVEVSVSLRGGHRGQGVGSQLYAALFEHLAGEPVHAALAGIALPNDASVALHRKFGFSEVGTFREYAVKHEEYISSLWMQRML